MKGEVDMGRQAAWYAVKIGYEIWIVAGHATTWHPKLFRTKEL